MVAGENAACSCCCVCEKELFVSERKPAFADPRAVSRLIYVRSGDLLVQINGSRRICEKGSLLLTNAYELTTVSAVREIASYGEIRFTSAVLPGPIKNALVGKLSHNRRLAENRGLDAAGVHALGLDVLLDGIFSVNEDNAAAEYLLSGYLSMIFAKLADNVLNRVPDDAGDEKGDCFCGKAVSVLEDIGRHYTSVDERVLAEKYGVSYGYFSRYFKKAIGMPFSEYVNMRKINEAKRLLFETQMPVNRIAEKLGFSSASHLINVFRRYESDTPLQFRKRCAQSDVAAS